ncbi:SLC13 family permease [Amycolatopsis sp. NPDC058986]|uniref:SLC13 family permease n=1 Tax=unclassified Amycolatopsis TaxID=2618356 RepID=UPI00367239EF
MDNPTAVLKSGAATDRRVPLWPFAAGSVLVTAIILIPQGAGLATHGRIALAVFAVAVIAWVSGRLDDNFVGLAAATVLAFTGVVKAATVFDALGGETIWLLVAAFVLAAGLGATGLPAKAAMALAAKARTPRQLVHLVTLTLIGTALAVPATSGRAALALPVFVVLAKVLAGQRKLVRALALLFPAVILLSASATLIGAGAHVITSELLAAATGQGIGYGRWLLLGLPFAVVASHLAAEVVLLTTTTREDRRIRLSIPHEKTRLTAEQWRALAMLALVISLWCTESWHGLSPALVALLGALLITAPRLGTIGMSPALGSVPWSLLVFMATTAVLGTALATSGAARWLAGLVFGQGGSPMGLLTAVVVLSAAAHLVLQSRSARSSVLVPLVLPLAAASGLNPAAVAFASTVAAGFCHTLPSSAKPVALFAAVPGVPGYGKADLARLSAVLGPLVVLLVLAFAVWVWPLLGLPLSR